METVFRWSSRNPILSLFVCVAVCLLLASGVFRLRIDASFEHLLSEDDPLLVELREIRENFDNRPLFAVLVESRDLFSTEVLSALQSLDQTLGEIEGVEGSRSLFRFFLPVSSNGELRPEPLLNPIPTSPAVLASKRKEILSNRLLRSHLVNDRGDATLFLYYLAPERNGENPHGIILSRAEAILSQPIPGVSCALVGAPRIKKDLEDSMLWDLTRLTPISILVVGAVIAFFFRHFLALLLPLITGLLSCAATLGFMGHVGFEINVFLSTILVLVIVLGATEDLHILSEYFDQLAKGRSRQDAIAYTGSSTGTALFLAALTTVLGFASLTYTELEGMRRFAIASSFGLGINFLVTSLVVPACLALVPAPKKLPCSPFGLQWIRAMVSKVNSHRGKPILLAATAVALLLVAGLTRLETDTDYLRFFGKDAPVSRDFDRYKLAFPDAVTLTVVFETKSYNGVVGEEGYRNLLRLLEFLENECGSPIAFPDLVETIRKAGGKSPLTPDAPIPASELQSLLDQLPQSALKPFLDHDASRAAITLRTAAMSSSEILDLDRRIKAFASENFGDRAKVTVTGDTVLTARLCNLVTSHLVRNLALLGTVVAILISLITRSLRKGLISLIPNLLPVALTFGAMGWLGIPLSIATFPVANIAFGIALDDTIHFLLRYNRVVRDGLSMDVAMERVFDAELRPIVATSAIIGAGYLTMTFSPLRVNAEIGVLFAIAISTALLADLLLTPRLLKLISK
ncbi:MAG: MMPL family transporter [Verrucomicrobiae bacterium]|nr:MMPL family transporter [Verrucomicrobiae bacterium]